MITLAFIIQLFNNTYLTKPYYAQFAIKILPSLWQKNTLKKRLPQSINNLSNYGLWNKFALNNTWYFQLNKITKINYFLNYLNLFYFSNSTRWCISKNLPFLNILNFFLKNYLLLNFLKFSFFSKNLFFYDFNLIVKFKIHNNKNLDILTFQKTHLTSLFKFNLMLL